MNGAVRRNLSEKDTAFADKAAVRNLGEFRRSDQARVIGRG
jgi:hypothetical protein